MYIVITHDMVKSIAFYCMEGGGVIADSIAML